MKRATALGSLSRDHHHALVVALKLRRATADTAPVARREFLSYWEREGREHLRSEEEVLLPAFARHGDAQHDAVIRVLMEHIDLRRRAADVESDADLPLHQIRQLGELLHHHVRHEERVLFRLIEQVVPEAELAGLESVLSHSEGGGERCGS
jgi:iron-sulfur cluster repair protein YtfE (RIC family)